MQLNPHLAFNGQCEAAFKAYEECLGGKIVTMMTYEDSPLTERVPRAWRKKVLHATLALGEFRLTGADAPPGEYQKPQGFSILLNLGDATDVDRIFASLSGHGQVQMPLEETFWAMRFGMLVDQFGRPWIIQCGKLA
jgi:PhnB protein